MAVLNQIPIENVSMADIRDTLNAHGGSATNVLGSFFTSYNGNSKLKPVDNPAQVTLFNVYRDSNGKIRCDTDPTTSSGLIWGLKPCIHSGERFFNTMVAAFHDNVTTAGSTYGDWQVRRPTGGSGSPYRLADFRGYNPNAQFPFRQGVSGHENYEDGTLIDINLYTDEKYISFFVSGNPASDFAYLKDFFKVYQDHRLIVELYAASSLSDTSWKTSNPTKVFASTKKISEITDWSDSLKLHVVDDMGLSSGKFAVALFGLGKISTGVTTARTHVDGIIPPFASPCVPFYRQIKVQNYFNRRCNVVKYRFGISTSTWYTPTNPFIGTYKGLPTIHMLIEVEKSSSSLTMPSASLKVRALAYGSFNDGSTQKLDTGTASNSSGQSVTSVTIPSGSTGTFQQVYWLFDNLITSYGSVGGIVIQTSSDNGSTWDNISSLSMNAQFVS